ncbi:hypothetical protein ElyMa_001242500 [Elysia marginata]|uniref:Uncharacterized protein n=1 Tax=Elysia marginata TaxID=1093978 RepID=A0AAV4IB94_9GAST|nr:hypothetical protein ElyMa_001242500 [Elysia marginata]
MADAGVRRRSRDRPARPWKQNIAEWLNIATPKATTILHAARIQPNNEKKRTGIQWKNLRHTGSYDQTVGFPTVTKLLYYFPLLGWMRAERSMSEALKRVEERIAD